MAILPMLKCALLAGLIFDIADQVQDMAQRRRSALSGEVARVLGGFADGPE